MSYPPKWRVVTDTGAATTLMRSHPFAHLITAQAALFSTRIPMIADLEDGELVRLRGHLNAQNPQADGLHGQAALVTFDGPASYVSPNWRVDLSRAGTYDYEEVQVRGEIKTVDDIGAFRQLIDDLAALIEPQHAEIGDYPVWHTALSPPGYIERLYPAIVAFEIQVSSVHITSKLHQSFPEADRRSVADHLARSNREQSRAIADKIRQTLDPAAD
jgi:transcriptional regulator